MSCDRIAEALHHLPEKQLTGRNRLEGFAGHAPKLKGRLGWQLCAQMFPVALQANSRRSANPISTMMHACAEVWPTELNAQRVE
jgi:hypothetical protein